MAITKSDVDFFLQDFKIKLSVYSILFRDRKKNRDTVLELELRGSQREEIIKNLKTKDYSQGPITEEMENGADMWVFGKEVEGNEIYIKITLGGFSDKVICISFHIAEHPMDYPLK